MRALRGESGFTLIEALAALTITAAMLAVIGQLGFATVAAARRAETRLALAAKARAGLAALMQSRTSESEEGADWRLKSAPFAFDAGGPGAPAWSPQALRLIVASPSGGQIVIDTVRLRPTGAAQ